jgi:hypothetical protein
MPDPSILQPFTTMNSDYTIARKREYERRFGPYNDDDFRSPDDCPDDRRELVAEIKVSAAAVPLSDHLLDYAQGEYPMPLTEQMEPLFHKIMEWDRYLPRHSSATLIP